MMDFLVDFAIGVLFGRGPSNAGFEPEAGPSMSGYRPRVSVRLPMPDRSAGLAVIPLVPPMVRLPPIFRIGRFDERIPDGPVGLSIGPGR